MQTILYYRDYAARARRLLDNGDRRGVYEVVEVLAQGFAEIADALEAGEIVVIRDHSDALVASSYSWHHRLRNGH